MSEALVNAPGPGEVRARPAPGGGALYLLLFAQLGAGALLFLQTVLLLAFADAVTPLLQAFRIGFSVVDLLLFVGLLWIALADRAHRALVLPAALGAFFLLVIGILRSAALAGTEPGISLGITLALGVYLASRARSAHLPSRGLASAFAVVTLVHMAGVTLAIVLPSEWTRWSVWPAWAFEVVRPLVLALFAARILRGRRAGQALAIAPYRAPAIAEVLSGGEPPKLRWTAEPSDVPILLQAASSLSLYRLAFAVRIGLGVFTSFISLLALTLRDRSSMLFLLASPVAAIFTAIFMLVALGRAAPLHRVTGSHGAPAILALALGLFLDVVSFVAGLVLLASMFGFRDQSGIMLVLVLGYPASMVMGGIAFALVSEELARIGEKLDVALVSMRARLHQGLAFAAIGVEIGLVNGLLGLERHGRRGSDSLVFVLLAALGLSLAACIAHLVAIAAARRAIVSAASSG